MNDRESKSSAAPARRISHDLVEIHLRAQAHVARVESPAYLRTRIVQSLRTDAGVARQPTMLDRWRASCTATAALASVMLLLALVASMLRLNVPQPLAPGNSLSAVSPWNAITQVTQPLGDELRKPVPNPLVREARLIMRDARNTIATFQRQLPACPRVNSIESPATRPSGI